MKRKIQSLASVVFLCFNLVAQRDIDSVKKIIASSNDTNKVNALMYLAKKDAKSDTTSARNNYNQAIDLSIKLKYNRGIAFAICQKANLILSTQNDSAAFACLNTLLPYIDTLTPSPGHFKYLITSSSIYANNSQLENAVACYLKALKIADALKDKNSTATAYHGLAFAHMRLRNFDKAEQYGLKAIDLYKQLNNKQGITSMNANIGGIYLNQSIKSKKESDYEKAFKYLSEAAETGLQIGDVPNVAVCYTNLAILCAEKKNYQLALNYCRKALELKTQMRNKYGMVTTMNTMSEIFVLLKKPDSVAKYSFQALKIAQEINAPAMAVFCYNDIASYYELKNDPQKALAYFKRFKALNDSIVGSDKAKALAEAEEKYESEKKDKEIVLLGEQKKVKDQEITKQRVINYAVGGGLLVVLILSAFIFRQYSQKKKAHEMLELQNEIINEKNRNITDSINYAKVIQNAILLGEDELSGIFPNTFILFKPKDIVSGDFYWFAEKNGKKLIAAVDCTGHGVPGAFMSMIGSSFLNEIVNERGVTQPSEILGLLRDKIKKALKQKGEIGDSKDGMDIALLSFNEQLNSVEFAGANNGLCLVRSGSNEITEIAPDKRPIGYYMGKGLPFTNHKIELKKGDALYIFTDGYADQFGGPKGKKFKYKQLVELILANNQRPAHEQKQLFSDTIESWKGKVEQTDDICLIGIKI